MSTEKNAENTSTLINGARRPAATETRPSGKGEFDDEAELDIGIHLSTAKAIADIAHICAGGALDGSDSRVEELDVRTLPSLLFAIEHHIAKAQERIEEMEIEKLALRRAKGSAAASH